MSTDAKISPVKLAHLVFRTPRYDAMVKWYCTVLEATAVFADAMLTFATYDDEHHRIAFVNLPHLSDLDPGARCRREPTAAVRAGGPRGPGPGPARGGRRSRALRR